MLIRFTSIIATISLFASVVSAKGQIAQVVDANDFCVFLPPTDATDRIISNSEWNANAFCLGKTPLATGAEKMPTGFIKSAHFVKTDAYVQVTGQMDYAKAKLVGTDFGGQMDVRAPMGSSCAGWKYYVNLIEPTGNTYCMRCCNDDRNCNRGISEKGCAHIIPGDYSGPNDGTGAGVSAHTTTATPATTTSASTTKGAIVALSSPAVAGNASPAAAPAAISPAAAASPASNSTISAPPSAKDANSASVQNVSAQSVNAATSSKPTVMAVGAGLLISAAMFA